MADEQTQELPEAQATDSSDVAEKFQTTEFTRVNQDKEAIEKIADKIASTPELSEPESQEELPEAQAEDSSTKPDKVPPVKETFSYEKWDGKVESLPEKLQKIVKDNQAMATAKAQEVAQLKQQLEQVQIKRDETVSQPLLTPEEYEEAQLNPAKFIEVIDRVAARAIEKKAAELMPVITQVQHTQRVAENEKAINDFAKEHEDFWDLHDANPEMFMSIIGQTKDLTKTYSMLKQFKEAASEKAKQEAQARVKEKKAASTFGRTTKHTENVMYVEGTQDDVLAKQIELTMAGKNVQVKLKK